MCGKNYSARLDLSANVWIGFIVFRIYIEAYAGYGEQDVNLAVLDRFSDSGSIGAEYKTAMAYLVSIGIFSGTMDGRLDPGGTSSRAMTGVLLARVLQGLDTSRMKDYQDAVDYVLTH